MRTKTLVLSAIVGALSSASLMAQVYSLNAVGYINVTLQPGFQVIANQLNTTNNCFSPMLDSQVLSGVLDGVQFFKFTGTSYTEIQGDMLNSPPWDGPATTATLNPGEACFANNPFSTNITITFVGTVLQGSLTNTLAKGFGLVSSMVPQAGVLDADLGLPAVDGDQIFFFTGTSWAEYQGDSLNAPPWDAPSGYPTSPTVKVGQGFFYNAVSAPNQWVRSFSVN